MVIGSNEYPLDEEWRGRRAKKKRTNKKEKKKETDTPLNSASFAASFSFLFPSLHHHHHHHLVFDFFFVYLNNESRLALHPVHPLHNTRARQHPLVLFDYDYYYIHIVCGNDYSFLSFLSPLSWQQRNTERGGKKIITNTNQQTCCAYDDDVVHWKQKKSNYHLENKLFLSVSCISEQRWWRHELKYTNLTGEIDSTCPVSPYLMFIWWQPSQLFDWTHSHAVQESSESQTPPHQLISHTEFQLRRDFIGRTEPIHFLVGAGRCWSIRAIRTSTCSSLSRSSLSWTICRTHKHTHDQQTEGNQRVSHARQHRPTHNRRCWHWPKNIPNGRLTHQSNGLDGTVSCPWLSFFSVMNRVSSR